MKKVIMSLVVTSMLVSCGGEKEEQKENKKENEKAQTENKKIETEINTTDDRVDELNKEKNASVTTIEFEKKEHDFGMIPKDSKVKTVFKFTNTGEHPYVIDNARGSCGCTVPSYPKTPIAPGATSEIEVEFNSANKHGEITKSVTLKGNTEPMETTLIIKGKIEE